MWWSPIRTRPRASALSSAWAFTTRRLRKGASRCALRRTASLSGAARARSFPRRWRGCSRATRRRPRPQRSSTAGWLAEPTNLVIMGRVLGPWGVKGAVKVESFGRNLWKFSTWWVGGPGSYRKVAVVECREHGGHLVARFEGCTSPEAAQAYRGVDVALERDDLPETEA